MAWTHRARPGRKGAGKSHPVASRSLPHGGLSLPLLLVVIAWAVVFGALAARLAAAASRPVATWALYGAILGPIALLLLRAAPPGRCRRCESRVHGWELICRFCGEDVRGLPARRSTATSRALPDTTGPGAVDVPDAHSNAAVTPAVQPRPDPGAAAREAERLTANTRNIERSTAVSATPGRREPAAPQPGPRPAPTAPEPRVDPRDARPGRRRRREQPDPGRTLGAGLFLTGSASLQPGYRYTIAVTDTRLRILGPLDLDPGKVVMDRDLAPFDATVTEDRVMLTEGSPDRPRMFLVFERISGTTPEGLADEIARAVQAVPRAG